MRNTPNLNLIVWDQNNDEFSSTQLAANWDAIDAQFGSSSVDIRPSRFLESGATLPVASLTNGRMFYLTATDQGIPANTICKYDGTSWKAIGRPEILSSLPVTGNYAGRMVVLSSTSGGFGAWSVVLYDGSAWQIVGGIGVFTTAPVTNNYAGRLVVVTADPGFPAYSLLVFNGSSYSRVEKRGVEVVGALPGSPYAGQVVVLNTAIAPFRAWDVIRYDGSAWAKANSGMLPGTALPGSPSDGDTYLYQADATNGVNWRFQYNAGSTAAYKWEFTGGADIIVEVPELDSAGSAAIRDGYVDMAHVGPQFTLPLNGDWEFTFGGSIGQSQSASVAHMALKFGAAATDDADSIVVTGSVVSPGHAVSRTLRHNGLLAGDVIKAQYGHTGSSNTFTTQRRFLVVRPIRVS